MQTVLGEQPCPILGKNSASPSLKYKRAYSGRGGSCMKTNSGLFVEKVGRRNFSVNFIGTGFIDG
jgi:hypothetical protein